MIEEGRIIQMQKTLEADMAESERRRQKKLNKRIATSASILGGTRIIK